MLLYGTRVATITDHDREIRLRWSQVAYERWGQGARVLSHLLSPTTGFIPAYQRRPSASSGNVPVA
jgi:hypothetical protein